VSHAQLREVLQRSDLPQPILDEAAVELVELVTNITTTDTAIELSLMTAATALLNTYDSARLCLDSVLTAGAGTEHVSVRLGTAGMSLFHLLPAGRGELCAVKADEQQRVSQARARCAAVLQEIDTRKQAAVAAATAASAAALAEAERIAAEELSEELELFGRASTARNLGLTDNRTVDWELAVDLLQQLCALRTKRGSATAAVANSVTGTAACMCQLGAVLIEAGQPEAAVPVLHSAADTLDAAAVASSNTLILQLQQRSDTTDNTDTSTTSTVNRKDVNGLAGMLLTSLSNLLWAVEARTTQLKLQQGDDYTVELSVAGLAGSHLRQRITALHQCVLNSQESSIQADSELQLCRGVSPLFSNADGVLWFVQYDAAQVAAAAAATAAVAAARKQAKAAKAAALNKRQAAANSRAHSPTGSVRVGSDGSDTEHVDLDMLEVVDVRRAARIRARLARQAAQLQRKEQRAAKAVLDAAAAAAASTAATNDDGSLRSAGKHSYASSSSKAKSFTVGLQGSSSGGSGSAVKLSKTESATSTAAATSRLGKFLTFKRAPATPTMSQEAPTG
jgi:hypothetical protein